MKLIKSVICAVIAATCLSSCSITKHSAFSPGTTQLTIQMSDLEYIGETEISVEYRKYLGIIDITDSINGEAYTGDVIKIFPIVNSSRPLLPQLSLAAYKLAEEFPEADYFIVTSQDKQTHHLFLGSHVEASAKVKAYSFKK